MTIKEIIQSAGETLHTIMITAREKDGFIETREAEPYSYRVTAGTEKLFCYDIRKGEIRNIFFTNIISVRKTDNKYTPRWDVEV